MKLADLETCPYLTNNATMSGDLDLYPSLGLNQKLVHDHDEINNIFLDRREAELILLLNDGSVKALPMDAEFELTVLETIERTIAIL